MTHILQTLLANKHTSGSALAYAAVKVGAVIAVSWFPAHEKQIRDTADALEGFAVLYLGAAAGDAIVGQQKRDQLQADVKAAITTGDTSILEKKPDAPTPPKP